MKKVSFKDLEVLIDELNRAGDDKTRVIDDISNKNVREILYKEIDAIEKSGITLSKLCCVGGVLGVASSTIGTGGVATGVVGAAGSTIGTGSVAAGVGSLAFTGGGTVVGGLSATAVAGIGGEVGGTAGSAVPGIGNILGVAAGAAIGFAVGSLFGKGIEKKKKIKLEKYLQATLKRERYWRDIELEFNELKGKFKTIKEENERLKYIIAILVAKEDLDNIL